MTHIQCRGYAKGPSTVNYERDPTDDGTTLSAGHGIVVLLPGW